VLVFLNESDAPQPDFTVTMDRASFYLLVSGAPGAMNYAVTPGFESMFKTFLAMLDTANPRFPIVTPKHTLPPIASSATLLLIK
jgi:alkyl sulfatase BDS1-like metallo-beta-lactamase superfamily hydrolase